MINTNHEGEHHGHDAALELAVGLVTLGSDRVELVDKDDGRGVLLGFLESATQVGFGVTGHLRHDFRT